MILVLAFGALLLIGSLVAGAIGIASLLRGMAPLVVLGVGAAIVALFAVGVVFALGVGHGESAAPSTSTGTSTSASASASTTTTATNAPTSGPEVALVASRALPYGFEAVLDEMSASAVLRISASGFEPETAGVIEQCTVGGCANEFPVSFDINGRARIQYFASDGFAAGFARSSTCRADAPPCAVHLHDGKSSAFLTTVFRDTAPPPRRVTVDPSRGGLVDGAPVRVAVSGFIPGERVQAMLCSAPDAHGLKRCGAPGPVAPFTIDADGTGRTAIVVRQTRVGSDGAPCGRDSKCGIVVAPTKSSVPGAVFAFTFAAGPGARYDFARWFAGVCVALALLGLAFFLARNTDWRKPTEADTPDLDGAVMSDG